jgi:hypothetical protein
MTPSVIDPATLWLVAQCLNQLHHCVLLTLWTSSVCSSINICTIFLFCFICYIYTSWRLLASNMYLLSPVFKHLRRFPWNSYCRTFLFLHIAAVAILHWQPRKLQGHQSTAWPTIRWWNSRTCAVFLKQLKCDSLIKQPRKIWENILAEKYVTDWIKAAQIALKGTNVCRRQLMLTARPAPW